MPLATSTFFGILFLAAPLVAIGAQGVAPVETAGRQEKLTLEQAIVRAKRSNGTIAAADRNYRAAQSGVRSAYSQFFPSITPEYRYVDQDQDLPGSSASYGQAGISANWLVLDGGQRSYAWARSRNLADASKYGTLWTLRTVLFSVTSQFYNALRAEELLKVADAQVERAKQVLDVVKKQVEVGEVAAKEVLQAEADLANAIVAQITARNQVNTSHAILKATIGWPAGQALPALSLEEAPPLLQEQTLEAAIRRGLQDRPDLQSTRKRVQAGRYDVLTAERNASLDWTLQFQYSRNFEPNDTFNRSIVFAVSYPLFDAGFSREALRQSRLSYEAAALELEQQEREVRSEIESAFLAWEQNAERLKASDAALKAARLNYAAATESQAAGVANILDVTNARIALVTAETNYVQAVYDFYISDAELRLVSGQPLYGESL